MYSSVKQLDSEALQERRAARSGTARRKHVALQRIQAIPTVSAFQDIPIWYCHVGTSGESFRFSNRHDTSRWLGKSPWQVRDNPVCVVLMKFGNEHDETRQTDKRMTSLNCHGEKWWSRRLFPCLVMGMSQNCRERLRKVGAMECGVNHARLRQTKAVMFSSVAYVSQLFLSAISINRKKWCIVQWLRWQLTWSDAAFRIGISQHQCVLFCVYYD